MNAIDDPAYDDCFSSDNLKSIYQRVGRTHYHLYKDKVLVSTGADQISNAVFENDLDKHCRAISRKAIQGRYTFNPLLEHELPKDGGGTRTISIGSIRDGLVQRALYLYLYPVIDRTLIDNVVFAYRQNRSVHHATFRIQSLFSAGATFVFESDFKKFFDTLDHDLLIRKLDNLELDDRASKLLYRFLKTGSIPSATFKREEPISQQLSKSGMRMRTIGVPQGGVLSGLLANLYLADFDNKVSSRFPGLVRYADDFIICTNSPKECKTAHELVLDTIADQNISIHDVTGKTTICSMAEQGIEFLGFKISSTQLRIRQKNIDRFMRRFSQTLTTVQVCSDTAKGLHRVCDTLSYKIRGPKKVELQRLVAKGGKEYECHRSWIGFFRIVDDETQIRKLDHWIRKQISNYMWRHYQARVTLKQMQEAGLPSLIKCLYIARECRRVTTDTFSS